MTDEQLHKLTNSLQEIADKAAQKALQGFMQHEWLRLVDSLTAGAILERIRATVKKQVHVEIRVEGGE